MKNCSINLHSFLIPIQILLAYEKIPNQFPFEKNYGKHVFGYLSSDSESQGLAQIRYILSALVVLHNDWEWNNYLMLLFDTKSLREILKSGFVDPDLLEFAKEILDVYPSESMRLAPQGVKMILGLVGE